jgi:multiple sugar transport system permease protein
MMTPVIFFNLVMGIIGSFQIFNQAYIMTDGGPNNASLFFVYYLYLNAFRYGKMGYACALAWILFLAILALTLIVFKSSSYWVFYEMKKGK